MVYTEVCASLRYSESEVMLRKWTGSFIDCITSVAAVKSRQSVPTLNGMDMLRIGLVSFAHFMPSGLFQSKLLQNFHSFIK
ncbi:hypothetical protein Hanom_Chr14g01328031 [Helianthus anomalus]